MFNILTLFSTLSFWSYSSILLLIQQYIFENIIVTARMLIFKGWRTETSTKWSSWSQEKTKARFLCCSGCRWQGIVLGTHTIFWTLSVTAFVLKWMSRLCFEISNEFSLSIMKGPSNLSRKGGGWGGGGVGECGWSMYFT